MGNQNAKRLVAPLVLASAAAALGCTSSATIYETKTILHVNQVANLWADSSYRYVETALQASGSAAIESEAAKRLAGQVMNKLVSMANLGPNKALVDVTLEEGSVDKNGTSHRVVTLRGDVIEFLQ